MTLMTILGPSGLLLAAGSVVAYAMAGRKRSKNTSKPNSTAKPSTPPQPRPLPKPPSPSPFLAGSNCTAVATWTEVDKWIREVVGPVLVPRVDAYDVPLHEHEQARRAVEEIVDEVFAKAAPDCMGFATSATRLIWKALWCEVVVQLISRGKLDEEIEDIARLCTDPDFDPRAPNLDDAEDAAPMPTWPPQPPWHSAVPMPPMGGNDAGPPPNLWMASSRRELSELGVMRMMEGTAAGAPIFGPAAHVVVLAVNPLWPALEHARADMMRHAIENPGLAFVEVSFSDTQRHFGKPHDVPGMTWALAAAGPDGKVYPTPIVRTDPWDPSPSEEHWAKVIAHASGFVGAGPVRSSARRPRFGDLLRSILRSQEPRAARARVTWPRRASQHTPSRRRG